MALGLRSITAAATYLGLILVSPNAGASFPVITVKLSETPEAFKNPMKGFRPNQMLVDKTFREHEYATIFKHYIKYTDLEQTAADGVEKIIEWSNENWSGIEKRNLKIIPRVAVVFPGLGEYWPDGVPAGDWTSTELRNRFVGLVEKLGKAWDNDPRVAAVEMGLWGKWGEHQIFPEKINGDSIIPWDFQLALGNAFSSAFKNKKVMARYPHTFWGYSFGFFWDSFGMPEEWWRGRDLMARNVWRTEMIGGEIAYDWGDQTFFGGSPDGTVGCDACTDYVTAYIAKTHVSSLGWVSDYDPTQPGVEKNAARMQKTMGYRFVIKEATFPAGISNNETFSVSFDVSNVGSAPFYYKWPVGIRLLDSNRNVVWSDQFEADITRWMPGEKTTIQSTFSVSNLPAGSYVLAVTVLDPASGTPSLRFANSNYYEGGWTPLGKLGVGKISTDQDLGEFDLLKPDQTLHY
ncbi:MAG TPA: DUF4832 domain-containing protein [Bdellovibrionota bacterium]|nr:DUF4832 domain-containing protein [Bdellovibrionota bacterium]